MTYVDQVYVTFICSVIKLPDLNIKPKWEHPKNIVKWLDQVNFVEVKLVIRSILRFSLVKLYRIIHLNIALLPRNLLLQKVELKERKTYKKYTS